MQYEEEKKHINIIHGSFKIVFKNFVHNFCLNEEEKKIK